MRRIDTSLTFSASDQSLWRPGPAESFRIDTGEYLIYDTGELTYNFSADAGVVEFSAQAYFGMRFGLVAWANLGDGGSWGATYELDLSVGIPDAQVVSRQNPDQTYLPRSQMFFSFDQVEIVSATIASEGFEIGDDGEISAGLDLIIDVQAGVRHISVETIFKDFDFDDLRIINVDETINLITVSAELPEYTVELFTGVELTARVPQGADTEGESTGSGVVSARGFSDTEFLALDADLDELLTELLSKAGPQAAAVAEALQNTVFLEREFSIGPIDIEITVVDITAHMGLGLTESVTLDIRDPSTITDPNDPTSGLPNVSVLLTSDNGTPDDESDDVSTVARLGDSNVAIFAPYIGSNYGTATVNAEYSINQARFGHTVGLGLNAYIAIDILTVSVDVWGLGDSWGPLFHRQFPEDSVFDLGTLYSDSFLVDGAIFGTDSDQYEVFFVEERIAPPGWDPTLPSAEAAVYGYFEANNQQLEALFTTLNDLFEDLYPGDPFLIERPLPVDSAHPPLASYDFSAELSKVHFLWQGAYSTNVTLAHGNGSRVTIATPTSIDVPTAAGATPVTPTYGALQVTLDSTTQTAYFSSLDDKYRLLFHSVNSREIQYTYVDRDLSLADRSIITGNVTNVLGGDGADVMVYHYDRLSSDTRGGEFFDGGNNIYRDSNLNLQADIHIGDLFVADLSHFTTSIDIDLAQSVQFENDGLTSTSGGFTIRTYQTDPTTGEILLDPVSGERLTVVDDPNRIVVRNVEALALRTGDGADYLVGGTFNDVFLTGGGNDIVRLVNSIPMAGVSAADTYYDVDDDFVHLGDGDDVAIVEMSNMPGAQHYRQFTDVIMGGLGVDRLFVQAGNQGLRYDISTDGSTYVFGGSGIGALASHDDFAQLLALVEQTRSDLWTSNRYGNEQSFYGSAHQHVLMLNGTGNRGAVEFGRDVEQVSIIPDAPEDANGNPLTPVQGAGDDLLVYMGGSRYDGGAGGIDTFLADFSTLAGYRSLGQTGEGVAISLAQTTSYFGATSLQNIDRLHVRGTFDFDVITGGALDDYIDGGDADDVLYGGVDRASDTLIGGSGNDLFTWASDGDDLIEGGFGVDTLNISYGGRGSGHFVQLFDANGAAVGPDLTTNVDPGSTEAEVTQFFDQIASATTTVAGFGSDHAVTYSGVERVNITGSVSRDDVLLYQNGNYYNGGNSSADGDLFIADFRGQQVGINFEVRDFRTIGQSNGYWLGNEVYIDGIDRALIFGGEAFDTFAGGRFSDMFHGGGGNDIMIGLGGNDTLLGGTGSDTFFYNNQGHDIIVGGTNATNSYVNGLLVLNEAEEDRLNIMNSSGPLRVAIRDTNGDFILNSRQGMALSTSSHAVLMQLAENSQTAPLWQYYTTFRSNLISTSAADVTYSEMEAVDIAGSDLYDDLIVYQNGMAYVGGEGYRDADMFLGDFRAYSENLTFDATHTSGEAYDIGQGTQIADFERFFLLLGAGDDTVQGGDLNDTVHGGEGDDQLLGGLGDDMLAGDAGNDRFEHTGGHDTIDGGDGANDSLLIGAGNDPLSLRFFDSADTQIGTTLSMLNGGPSFADFAAYYALTTTAYTVIEHGDSSVQFRNIENLQMSGSGANDVLLAGTSASVLFGGGGNDALIGRGGDDFLSGGEGSDVYVFGRDFGNDVIFGESFGSSRLVFTDYAMSDLTFSANGVDLIISQGANTVRVVDYFAANTAFGLNFVFETTEGIATRDFTSLGVTSPGAPIAGQNYLGTAGNDNMAESTVNRDTYRGFAGDDGFQASAGADLYDGGAGVDLVDYLQSLTPININLSTFSGQGGLAEGDFLVSIESIFGTPGDDTIAGNAANNTLGGEAGNDSLFGADGADILLGELGNDTLSGGAGRDTLLGGEGNDSLLGGSGTDLLVGAAGNDVLDGGDGADLLDDGTGNDTSRGGAGNDIFAYRAGLDVWDGGEGSDFANFAAFESAVLFDLSATNSAVTRDALDLEAGSGTLRTLVQMTNIENIRGSYQNDDLRGNNLGNLLDGSSGNDTLTGHGSADTLIGSAGIDTLDYSRETGAAGVTVRMDVEGSEFAIDTHGSRDTLSSIEIVIGTARADEITGNAADNVFFGGAGNDALLAGFDGHDLIFGQAGDDTLRGGEGSDSLSGGDGNDLVLGDGGNDLFYGSAVTGVVASFSSGLGNDTYNGGSGIDTLSYSTTTAGISVDLTLSTGQVNGTEVGIDTLIEIDNIVGGMGNDLMVGNGESNTFSYFGGTDAYTGGGGDDVVSFLMFGSAVWVDLANPNEVRTADRSDVATGPYRTIAQLSSIEGIWGSNFNDRLSGNFGANVILGGQGNDVIDGGHSTIPGTDSDRLFGGEGDDRFIGAGADGRDTFDGGTGTDSLDYSAETAGVIVSLVNGNGNDVVYNVERLIGTGFDDQLTGDSAANIMQAGAGNDLVDAGLGDDLIAYSGGLDIVRGGGGLDSLDYSMFTSAVDADLRIRGDAVFTSDSANWDVGTPRLITQLPDRDIENLIGSDHSDRLQGNEFANMLNGGLGNDVMFGHLGNDMFAYTGGLDSWDGGGGTDTGNFSAFRFAVDVNLTATGAEVRHRGGENTLTGTFVDMVNLTSVENIIGTSFNDRITGDNTANELSGFMGDDVIIANGGDDILNGGTGNDLLRGGLGADTLRGGDGIDTAGYEGSAAAVRVNLTAGTATGGEAEGDVLSQIEILVGSNHNDVLVGSNDNNELNGNDGDDTLDGQGANDRLIGGLGNDSLIGGDGFDMAILRVDRASVSVQSTYGGMRVTSAEGVDFIAADVEFIQFNDGEITFGELAAMAGPGDDTLIGTPGSDVLSGLAGNDRIEGRAGNDHLFGGTGNDTLLGEAGTDRLVGGIGNDRLDGGADRDQMIGGTGNDTYVVEQSDDVVIENLNEGTDTVFSGVSYALTDNVENLSLTGAGNLNAMGNSLANVLTGNSGNNRLNGNGGDDTLRGGGGVDTAVLAVASSAVTVTQSGAGLVLTTTQGAILIGADVEYVEFTDLVLSFGELAAQLSTARSGTSGGDTMIGTPEADILAGLADNDRLEGRAQDDILVGGSGNDTLLGEGGSDRLDGGSGTDVLDGGAGADQHFGGAGNDSYIVDDIGDRVVERAGEGSDSVSSSVSFELSEHVEALTLTGTADLSGTGNSGNNLLVGNSGANTLRGAAGDDTLNGGAGNDTLIGGEGSDTAILSGILANATFNFDNPDFVLVTDASGTNRLEGIEFLSFADGTVSVEDQRRIVIPEQDVTLGAGNYHSVDYGIDNSIEGGGAQFLNIGPASQGPNQGNNQHFTTEFFDGGGRAYYGGSGFSSSDTTSGTVNHIRADFTGGNSTQMYLQGMRLPLEELFTADWAYFQTHVFNGDDKLIGSYFADHLVGYAGDDELLGGMGDKEKYNIITDNPSPSPSPFRNAGQSVTNPDFFVDDGDDTLDGMGGNDSIDGGTGNDLLIGGTGNDELWGGGDEGMDTLRGGAGNDTMHGGDGQDTAIIDALSTESTYRIVSGSVEITGADGVDIVDSDVELIQFSDQTLRYEQLVELARISLAATPNADTLIGTPNADTIAGLAGDDIIRGLAGNDVLSGDEGNDTLEGGDGDDTLDGGDGRDVLQGGAGDDLMHNSDGNDMFDGGEGTDRARFNLSFSDVSISYNDGIVVTSALGVDTFRNTEVFVFNDRFIGAQEMFDLSLNGTPTSLLPSTVVVNEGLINLDLSQYFADPESDALTYIVRGLPAGLSLDPATGIITGTLPATSESIEFSMTVTDVIGNSVSSSARLRVESVAAVNILPTGAVAISGELRVGQTLTASTTVADADGIDTGTVVFQWLRNGVEISGATGETYVLGADDLGQTLTVAERFTDLLGTPEEVLSAATAAIDPAIVVGPVGVELVGTAGADRLVGGDGDDTLIGLDGPDTLIGGDGDDFIFGSNNTGPDSESDLRDVVFAGNGNDSVLGGYGNDELRGDAGNDTLEGGYGADTMIGGTGDDFLTGSAWGDVLVGGDGNDFINGGFGYDRTNGGLGADRFFHNGNAGHGSDWIQDFDSGQGDVLQYGGGAATAADFLVQRAFTVNAGDALVQEVFVTHIPSGNLLWALVDGGAQTSLNVLASGTTFDLLE